MNYSVLDFLSLLGAVCLFLYGMKVMSEGLQKVAGDRLRNILGVMTRNRVSGVITGIVIIIVGVIALLFSVLQRYGYYNLLDGDADMYVGLYRRMILFFVIGIILVVIGVSCIIIRR